MIKIIDINDKKALKEFIFLPEKIHLNNNDYLPPIWDDEWKFYNPKQNTALAQSEVVLALSYQNEIAKGRIMGIIPHFYNKLKNENTARFYAFDCYNLPDVAAELLAYITNWASQKRANLLIGPYGFSDKDPQGAQIEGFEHTTVLATPNNAAYLPQLIEKQGFTKYLDCLSYQLPIPKAIPVRYQPIIQRALQNNQLKLLNFKTKWALRPYIIPVLKLVNLTYAPLFGFVPMSNTEIRKFAAQYLPILNPAFVKIIVNEANEPVAFGIGMPNISAGIKKARGRLLPFGFVHILWPKQKSPQLDLLLGAVNPAYRGRGLTMVLAHSLFEAAHKHGLEYIDSHLVLENNLLMRAEYEKMGGLIYKRYRVFQKKL
jgi:GNAT superfamily N-acetyltransferase